MSKEKVNTSVTTDESFNILDMNPTNPFNDGLDMTFADDVIESAIIKDIPKGDEPKDDNPANTEIINDDKDPKDKEKLVDKKVDKPDPKKTDDTPTTTEVDDTEEGTLHTFYNWLHENGVVESLEEGKTVESEDDLKGVISTTIKKGIEDYKSSKPEEVQKFIDFVDNGGNPREFHRLYYEQRSWKDLDTKSESNQELIVREALKASGWDDEDIDSEISDKKDLGKLEPLAQKFHKKLIAGEEEEKESLIEAQKEYQKRQTELANKQWNDFKEDLYKKEEVQGFKLTPKVKDDLWNFMTKVDKKSGKTPLQIHNETNTNAQVLYAYLAMNNWDIKKLETQVKTKVTSELTKKLKNITDSREKFAKGGSEKLGSDRPNNSFSGFKTALQNNQI